MKKLINLKKVAFVAAVLPMLGMSGGAVLASAGQTKVNIYDNTHDGWNVTIGTPDPVIGFVNYRPTTPGDPTNIKVVVSLKDAAPNCDYDIQLVTDGTNDGGLAPDGFHTGFITTIGSVTTNAQGKANTGEMTVDVTTVFGAAASGEVTYAHIDLEDFDGDCVEADGTGVSNNEYGASGKQPGSTLDLPDNIRWVQP